MATVTAAAGSGAAGSGGLLSRRRIIAKTGFNRWLVPPAALAIHLCIGMAYGFSVFWLPLSKAVGITTHVSCPDQVCSMRLSPRVAIGPWPILAGCLLSFCVPRDFGGHLRGMA